MPKSTMAETEVRSLNSESPGVLEGPIHAFSMFPLEVARTLSRLAVHRRWSNGSIVLPVGRVVPFVLPLPVDAMAFDDCETLQVDREILLDMMRADGNALAAARG
jgi:hypothetical protein